MTTAGSGSKRWPLVWKLIMVRQTAGNLSEELVGVVTQPIMWKERCDLFHADAVTFCGWRSIEPLTSKVPVVGAVLTQNLPFATGCEDVDWIHLYQDRVQWRTLVNTVMNFRVPSEWLSFMELVTSQAEFCMKVKLILLKNLIFIQQIKKFSVFYGIWSFITNFYLHNRFQTGFVALPASYPMGTGSSFPGG